jgi:hypothetical protein
LACDFPLGSTVRSTAGLIFHAWLISTCAREKLVRP